MTKDKNLCVACNVRWKDETGDYCPECQAPFDDSCPVVSLAMVNSSSQPVSEEKIMSISPEQLKNLRAAFKDDEIQKVNKSGTTLSYVSHASVIDRVLSVDPEWNIEPAYTVNGLPVLDRDAVTNIPVGAWFKMTLLGNTKLCYGSYEPSISKDTMSKMRDGSMRWSDTMDPNFWKKIQSDAVSRGGMQWGIALQLWSKVELEGSVADEEKERRKLLDEVKAVYPSVSDDIKNNLKDWLAGRKIAELDITGLLHVLNEIKGVE